MEREAPIARPVFDSSKRSCGPIKFCFCQTYSRINMTLTCASRHNGIHFLNIWTWTAKSSEPKMFPAFWLVNTLCATTAYNFSTTQLPKVFRRWGAYAILTWECECASRIFAPQRRAIFDLSFNFRTRRFSGQNIRKKHCASRCFYLFARFDILSSYSLFSGSFSFLIFFLLTLSSLSVLAMLLHLSKVGSLTSEPPSSFNHLRISTNTFSTWVGLSCMTTSWSSSCPCIVPEWSQGCRNGMVKKYPKSSQT